MDNISVANELQDAIEMMIAEPDSSPPKVDLKIGELLGIVAELRLLPDPEFRSALKAELLGEELFASSAIQAFTRLESRAPEPGTARDILPTLFGAGYGDFPLHRGNFAFSLAMHVALIVAVASAGFWMVGQPAIHTSALVITNLSPYTLPPSSDISRGGGGGGDHDKLQASKGTLPRFSREQLTPPVVVVRNENPRLPAEPTVVGPPALSFPRSSQLGNPLSTILQPSNGTGSGGGIGSGSGGGVGSGYGPGVGPGYGGGIGGGVYRVGGGVSAPRAIYAPDPEYSDEARRAKFQGEVVLWAIVGPDGKPRDLRVARSLGMGLDQKAIEAVRQWKFAPAMKDDQPVAVQVNIEVDFRLY